MLHSAKFELVPTNSMAALGLVRKERAGGQVDNKSFWKKNQFF